MFSAECIGTNCCFTISRLVVFKDVFKCTNKMHCTFKDTEQVTYSLAKQK